MDNSKLIYGIGNALVDISVSIDDAVLSDLQISKGAMTLAEREKQADILKKIEKLNYEIHSGGSAANTLAGIALLGGKAFFTGKLADDSYGKLYEKHLKEIGIDCKFDSPDEKGHTGTSIVLVTPDAERTMSTYLGVSGSITKNDLDLDILKQSFLLYFEGYLWDSEPAKNACIYAMEFAKENHIKIAMTYSDPFCIERYRDDFLRVSGDYADYIFCNADEARIASGEEDLNRAADFLNKLSETVFITNNKEGAVVAKKNIINTVSGFTAKAVDTTGAGDAFAAGALFGIVSGATVEKAAQLGNFLASQTVEVYGARLSVEKKDEIRNKAKEVLSADGL